MRARLAGDVLLNRQAVRAVASVTRRFAGGGGRLYLVGPWHFADVLWVLNDVRFWHKAVIAETRCSKHLNA